LIHSFNQSIMSGIKKAGETVVKTALKEARAVTKTEAPFIEPATTSATETMMPWKGWVSRFLTEKLGQERFEALQEVFYYRPKDPGMDSQTPFPNLKVPFSATDPTKVASFRYPSPGSAPPVRIPRFEVGSTQEDPYNTSYYKRDTGRRYEIENKAIAELKLELMDPNSPEVQEMKEALIPTSSPGNKGKFATGPTDFDPTGLRATMSTNHAALEASLDANMPNHLPYPAWYKNADDEAKWYLDRGLPVPMGVTGEWTSVPVHRRIAHWDGGERHRGR
jgi:hypothetical protein